MNDEINWGYNCLTASIHHGRPETVWNLPLFQAVMMFGTEGLKQLVLTRIHCDARQYASRSDIQHALTEAWADRLRILAEEKFDDLLTAKMAELITYYDSSVWRSDVRNIIAWYKDGKLNPNYQPLHTHDSVNMLCRILGGMCSREVTR